MVRMKQVSSYTIADINYMLHVIDLLYVSIVYIAHCYQVLLFK